MAVGRRDGRPADADNEVAARISTTPIVYHGHMEL